MATTCVPAGSPGVGEAPPPWKAPPLLCAVVVVAAAAAWCAARALEWAWLRPRRLGRALRAQGLRGTAYRPLAGDAPLADRLSREARSRSPLPPGCHAVVHRAMPLFHHAMEEHGKTSITWFGPVPRVTIADPALVRQVLSNKFGHFEKVGFGQLQRLLHYGLSSHEGDKWARHRRIINPAFHLDKLKRMLPAFASCCADLVNRWEAGLAAAGGGGEPRCEVDVWPEMQRLTGDVISRAAFGSSYLEGRRIFQLQEEQVRLAMLSASKIHIPGYMMLPTRINRRMKRIAAEIEGILRGMIAKREDALIAGEATAGDDLLGLLLESNMEQSRGSSDGGGRGASSGSMSTDDIVGECKLFYFAGMETTSILLTWTLVVLCMHPEWQDRAREEVLRVLGGGTTPDYDGLSRLKIPHFIAGDHGAVRGAASLHAAAGGAPADVQADGARRRQVPGGRDAGAAAAVRPPRQGRVGAGRGRLQAGEVRGGSCRGVGRGPAAGVLPVRRGSKDLRRPELRAAGGQDGARHDPARLRARALAVVLARAVPSATAEAGARRAGHAHEAPLSCLCVNIVLWKRGTNNNWVV
ncbi:cytochrome P450 CYP72A616 isoform X1 [Setaria viridis]|uniref:cytochrome P450 CYP72A616 isoform X1 n=1 Tax=Setaria viridis TaxID=4556 RepID=UPI0014939429|nr:cytochrome P450 72A14-like isoform X1 [Setaria viridis]XP_034593646.1 cytochrome P450 72A14-like isoform X1 [Setaria viridis]XP_034593647.1 cytochrome P450 72A14-like isoform X1 [Setaria viridis]XP_034593648.1 cytochrome P450 72A14-like isoform X1 [Setaria viridis]XP_034593649.1 cytochrome P450 72A14-like isoform X1 [Setaria viridis]XP_034593650.1 cytochrome P450 72A14-like isoform X1 [Setaria viridis]